LIPRLSSGGGGGGGGVSSLRRLVGARVTDVGLLPHAASTATAAMQHRRRGVLIE
jgi:hypothetical protein